MQSIWSEIHKLRSERSKNGSETHKNGSETHKTGSEAHKNGSEATKTGSEAPINIDFHNSNRYRLVLQENDGSKTAYYFSAPIYNRDTRKLIDISFRLVNGNICATGSNSKITLTDNVLMTNVEGSCSIELPQNCNFISSKEVRCGNIVLIPTVNGVAFKCEIKGNEKNSFIVNVGEPFLNIRANDRCFALMRERFKPFVVFSCIGAVDKTGNIIAPAKIEYQKLSDKKYLLNFLSTSPVAEYIVFEANLYENKLFQDTTVESLNPSTNNAFGSVAFLGNTVTYGEQWLYSRLDYSKITDVMDKRIQKAVLHTPKLNHSAVELSAFKIKARFCSFGSNWNNKMASGAPISDSSISDSYQSLDITNLLVEPRMKTITQSEGMILRTRVKSDEFSVITTGDSYYCPQILEVNFI